MPEGRSEVSEARPCDPHLRSAMEVIGYKVAANDGWIGHVEDFIMDDEEWAIRYLAIHAGYWWPSRKVLTLPVYVVGIDWGTSVVRVNAPRETLVSGPTYSASHLSCLESELSPLDHVDRPGNGVRIPGRRRHADKETEHAA